jgi:hypothetical protein
MVQLLLLAPLGANGERVRPSRRRGATPIDGEDYDGDQMEPFQADVTTESVFQPNISFVKDYISTTARPLRQVAKLEVGQWKD